MEKFFIRFLATIVYFTSIYSHAFYPTYVSDTRHLTVIKEIYSGKSIVLESDQVGEPIHNKVKSILFDINGVDVGLKIKNLITGVTPGKYISLSISESNLRYYYGGGVFRTYYKNKLSFDVSNNYSVTYENEPVFSTGNWINPCYVGGASSGCYEP